MRRALQLARRGQGRVEPNPMVGCVLVRGGRVVGEGYHRRFGGAHAEVEALRRAGENARGATAFVNLEPCCHYGKTPPCTEALIRAGVARVVVGMRDPFPPIDGRGIDRLRRAGVRVDLGVGETEARELNAPFVTRVTLGRPYTILKWAQSLDGRIATRTGDSRWISDAPARRVVHLLRARVDAILVGIGTVLADNPELTARDVALRRLAARVVLDSQLRIPTSSRLIVTASAVKTVVFTTRTGLARNARQAGRLRAAGVELIACPAHRGRVSLRFAMRRLAATGITNLLVEGGGQVSAAFVDQRLADEAMVFVSPRLIGGDGAVAALGGVGAARIKDSPPICRFAVRRVGRELLYDLRFAH